MARRVAVVCLDAGGLAENVEHEETAIVVPRRDPEAIADALSRLAADPDRRRRMGEAGRRRVIERYRAEDQISSFERLYRGAVTKVAPDERSMP